MKGRQEKEKRRKSVCVFFLAWLRNASRQYAEARMGSEGKMEGCASEVDAQGGKK